MPCKNHGKKDTSCVHCLLSETTAISKLLGGKDPPDLKQAMYELSLYFKPLAKDELAGQALAALNYEIILAQKKEGRGWAKLTTINMGQSSKTSGGDYMDAPSNPNAITDEHRLAYRRFIGRRGTWVGFAELQALGRLFGVRFTVYYEQIGRDVEVGDPNGRQLNSWCLVFTGIHYEVSAFRYRSRVEMRTLINGLGDCALESFLTMCVLERVQSANQTRRDMIRGYAAVVETHDWNGLVPTSQEYWTAIDALRAYLAANMNAAEVDDAIVALGGRLLPKKDVKSSSKEEVEFDFGYDLKSLQKDLPWAKSKCSLLTKRVGFAKYYPIEISAVDGVCVLGGNITASKGLWAQALEFFKKVKGTKGVKSDIPSLYLNQVDKKELAWLDAEGRENVSDKKQLPTHIGVCLINVTTTKGTFAFLCAGLNMDTGSNADAKASACYMGSGNGLHSEKYQMGLTQLVLAAFGVPYKDLLSGHYFGAVISPPVVDKHDVKSVELIFANIACPCLTCQGHYANLMKLLVEVGIKDVTAYFYYFLDHADNWK